MRIATEADAGYMTSVMEQIIGETWPDGDHPPFDPLVFMTPPNFTLIVDGGWFGLIGHGLARLEVHTVFERRNMGRNAVRGAREAQRYLFIETNTYELITRVPGYNPVAKHLAEMMGFRTLFTRPNVWKKGGIPYAMDYLQLTVDDWILTGECRRSGEAFHKLVHTTLPHHEHHEPDPVHDCYVGAAIEMALAGNVDKSILFYNRYAAWAQYRTIVEQSRNPLRLVAGDLGITLVGRTIEVCDANCRRSDR
jgi:hypothetical protein